MSFELDHRSHTTYYKSSFFKNLINLGILQEAQMVIGYLATTMEIQRLDG